MELRACGVGGFGAFGVCLARSPAKKKNWTQNMNIPYLAGPCRVHTIKMTYRRHSVMNITKPLIKYAYLWKLSERPSLGVPGVGVRW